MALLAIVLFTILITSCQEEAQEVIDPNTEEVITANSNVARLIERTTLRDGSSDNILDSTSCTSIVLPVTVIANGLEITIDSFEDFETLEEIFDEFEVDEDILELIFPITVVLADHTEVVVDDEDDFDDLVDDCIEFGDDDDIECLDFVYPITINVFNSDNQVADVVTFTNDEDLFDFFDDLEEEDVVSIEFPISVLLYDDTQVEINSLVELENLIEDVEDECDEDDDNDFDDEKVDPSDFIEVLIDGDWVITMFYDEDDETAEFNGFIFTFLEDGTVVAKAGNLEIHGVWEMESDDGELEFEMDFGDFSPFDELSEDWVVVQSDDTIIRLNEEDDDDDEKLTFERPDANGIPASELANILTDGLWEVALFEEDDDNDTDDYIGFTLDFEEDGGVVVTNGISNIDGAWSEVIVDGEDKLVLNFGNVAPFDEFNDDWEIVEVAENRVKLRDVSDEDDDTEVLIFERL